ncbi:hypothetical protein BDN67DRAFT_1015424 [Paxillus ammoniavirescens]|nr:hypothetical protein BDN67DRAFT_1015424 [Paxillus ammoniavirescens]
MKAHWCAYDAVRLLHRDISHGSIILTKDGEGWLIDWELAKKVDENVARRRERIGAWQFMSAVLLRNPGMTHTLQDDIESFLHRGNDLRRLFDVIDFVEDGAAIGRTTKADPRYMEEPPPEEERALVGRQGHLTDMNMLHQSLKVSQCDEDMTLLKTSNWFIEPLEKALQTKSWPSDDKAQKGLDTQTSRLFTVAQMSCKSGQLTNRS